MSKGVPSASFANCFKTFAWPAPNCKTEMTALEIIVVVPLLLLAGYLAVSDLTANFFRRSRLKRLAEEARFIRHLQESRRRALRRRKMRARPASKRPRCQLAKKRIEQSEFSRTATATLPNNSISPPGRPTPNHECPKRAWRRMASSIAMSRSQGGPATFACYIHSQPCFLKRTRHEEMPLCMRQI